MTVTDLDEAHSQYAELSRKLGEAINATIDARLVEMGRDASNICDGLTDQPPSSGPAAMLVSADFDASGSVAGGADRGGVDGHAASAGTNTSGAGGRYPSDWCGRTAL